MKQTIAIVGSILLVIGLFIVLTFTDSPEVNTGEFDSYADETEESLPRNLCVEHTEAISMHIHPTLTIIVDGQQVPIPANTGVSETCMRALHTHEGDGEIHIEYPTEYEFMLGDFFANWGGTFNQNQILTHVADDTHRIRMTVNGVESTEFENLILKDLDQIVIHYE